MIKHLRLATRQSKLALWQANFVKNQLESNYSNLTVELLPQLTQGDKIQDKKLADFGGKGVFITDLEQALRDDKADIAVHSMKDVPPELLPEFTIAAFLARHDPRDVFLSNTAKSLLDLPIGAVVGTCSVRREAQLRALRSDLTITPLRGNVDTRLKKLDAGEFDAIILAAAGLERLGLTDRITDYFSFEQLLPSVSQGVIGVECLSENQLIMQILQSLNDEKTSLCVTAERAFVNALHGNCHSPIGAYAVLEGQQLRLRGLVASLDGQTILTAQKTGSADEPTQLGHALADDLYQQGAQALL